MYNKIISKPEFSLGISFGIFLIGFLFIMPLVFILNLQVGELEYLKQGLQWHELFFHNYKINLLIVMGGILLYIPSALVLVINGMVSGFFVSQSILSNNFIQLFQSVLAHALFEVPAMIISAAIGMQISIYIYFMIIKKEKLILQKRKIIFALLLMTLLTFIASLIEVSFSFLKY